VPDLVGAIDVAIVIGQRVDDVLEPLTPAPVDLVVESGSQFEGPTLS